ncbi:related to Protein RMD9-like, mitochondrial [Saccharomycodes ludwigii]|uniref:Related to Protein RMD9-like, mitochondrial n=1 Tax=Saccharomycodes ludwigii TaxID=36035 RepID=A0A376B5F3_9ASCO|nr:related to Protein RMD9-like, mitochondrial [Saccharomycodes ludwigii]
MVLRFVQQSNVLKQRVSNQFASSAKNIHQPHNIFSPQSIYLERTPSQELHYSTNSGTTTTTPNNVNSTVFPNPVSAAAPTNPLFNNIHKQQHQRSNNNNRQNHGYPNTNNNNTNLKVDPNSPWYHQVVTFDECVLTSLQMSRSTTNVNYYYKKYNKNNTNFNANNRNAINNSNFTAPLFWDSIGKAMGLYRILVETPEMNSNRCSMLIHLLHNGLRANRNQLTRMNKKPDYDSQSFHKEMTNYLCDSLREIASDVLQNKTGVNEYGCMHLITAFKELLLEEEAVDIWRNGLNNQLTHEYFLNPRVVGVILPILYQHGVSFDEISKLYQDSSNLISYFHPNLSVGMIRACLSAGENMKALELFTKLCEESSERKFGYLIETHLSFIGECKDLNLAESFFIKALNNEMPYRIDLQVSYVKKFMTNIWYQLGDFNKVYDVWYKSSIHYGSRVNHGISSSLNDTFFDIFFRKFTVFNEEGFTNLQNIIMTYNTIKPIDEPFFNIILTKAAAQWRDRSIIDFVNQSYKAFNIPKTIVAYRILLKSLGSIDNVSSNEILSRWNELVMKTDEVGQGFIANADWAALRDACVTWAQEKSDILMENNVVANNTNDNYNPAVQALNASGAFDQHATSNEELDTTSKQNTALTSSSSAAATAAAATVAPSNNTAAATIAGSNDNNNATTPTKEESMAQINERIILYLKVVRVYSKYCRDAQQYNRLTTGATKKYSILGPFLSQNYDCSDIYLPQFVNLRENN